MRLQGRIRGGRGVAPGYGAPIFESPHPMRADSPVRSEEGNKIARPESLDVAAADHQAVTRAQRRKHAPASDAELCCLLPANLRCGW
jgi:hypothetical protein